MARKKKKSGFWHAVAVFFGAIWIVIKYTLQIINIFVDRFLKYLNIALVWIGTNIFRLATKKKDKADFKEIKKENESKKEVDSATPILSKSSKGKQKVEAVYEPFSVLEEKEGDYHRFEENLFNNKSMIGIILGARGTGKSAIGIKLLENIHAQTERPVAAMGFNAKDMPEWINCIQSMEDIEDGSFILVDEGGILFSSRSSMSEPNKLLSELLLIARHKDLSVLFITQNSSNLEVNTIRQADYMILKPSSLLQRDFERKKIKDVYESAKDDFKKYKGERGAAYIYAHEFRGFISNPLPSFWNENVSKAFKKK